MGIWDRLGNVINSYVNDFGQQTSSRFKSSNTDSANTRKYSGDPDLDAAYEELDDFLNKKDSRKTWRDSEPRQSASSAKRPPEELRGDFACLGVDFGADAETCKAAYKKLLKIHHPDKHAGHEGNFKKATERSAKINAAWDKIEKWRNN